MAISVIYEDKNFLALNKPAGIAVHRGAGVKSQTLVDWLVAKYPEVKRVGDDPSERPGIVHRLDKGTSGVMLAARNQETFESLKRLFKTRRIEKTYLALVVGAPKKSSGIIDEPIGRMASQRTKRGTGKNILGARQAMTEYRVLERFGAARRGRIGGYSLIEAKPKTGRMHQIRVHLASIGAPVVGDKTYGRPGRASPSAGGARAEFSGLERNFLHAFSLEFSYPEGRRWRFEAALPADLQNILRNLRRVAKTDAA